MPNEVPTSTYLQLNLLVKLIGIQTIFLHNKTKPMIHLNQQKHRLVYLTNTVFCVEKIEKLTFDVIT